CQPRAMRLASRPVHSYAQFLTLFLELRRQQISHVVVVSIQYHSLRIPAIVQLWTANAEGRNVPADSTPRARLSGRQTSTVFGGRPNIARPCCSSTVSRSYTTWLDNRIDVAKRSLERIVQGMSVGAGGLR